jgi:hypothetical protein
MTISNQLHRLAQELEERERDLDQRELALAQAAEQLSQSEAVQQAMQCARQEATQKVVALIDLQLEQLGRAGLNAITLRTLRNTLLSDFQ